MHWVWIIAAIFIILIIFGPRRLTKLGGALGKSVKEFRKENSAGGGNVTGASTKDKT